MPRYSLATRIAAAKRFGLRVEVVPGAETRGSATYNPGCYVGHHTAGAKTGDRPSLNLCVHGSARLAGPLCEDFMPRAGGLVIVATGRSNNAGDGGFRGIVGNSGTMACEAEDDGDGTWTPAQIRDYPRIVASGLWMMGRDASWYCSHRTWAALTQPGRKIDPAGISDAWMQAQVAALLRAGSAPPPASTPKGTFVTYTAAEEAEILKAARQINSTMGAGQVSFEGTVEAILAGVQSLHNKVAQGDGALGQAIGSARDAVLGAVALIPTDGLSEEETQQLAEAIADQVGDVSVDEVLDAAGQRLYTPPVAPEPPAEPAG